MDQGLKFTVNRAVTTIDGREVPDSQVVRDFPAPAPPPPASKADSRPPREGKE